MGLVVVCSVSGAPGVTSACVGMAAFWPEVMEPPVVVECDPSGGDLAAWFALPASGLVDLTTRLRGSNSDEGRSASDALMEVARPVHVGGHKVPVVSAPPGGRQVSAALPVLLDRSNVLAPPDRTVIADVGRLGDASAAWPLLPLADSVIALAPGTVAHIAHLRARLPQLFDACGHKLAIAVAGGIYRAHEVAEVLVTEQVPVIADLPFSEASAALVSGQPVSRLRARRLAAAWQKPARDIAARLSKPSSLATVEAMP